MPHANLIHLATHGLLDDQDTRNSALAMPPGSGEDGLLTAVELFQMDLKFDSMEKAPKECLGAFLIV